MWHGWPKPMRMCGTRDAAQNWEYEYQEFMESIGFKASKGSPCVFWHPEKKIRAVIHGDDFTMLGLKSELMWFRSQLSKRFEAKFRGMLGSESDDVKEMTILNRTVKWTSTGIEYEADHRHVSIAMDQAGIDAKSKAVGTPHEVKEESVDEPLSQDLATLYRAIVARLNYLAQDRIDIQFAVKELCRFMSAPKTDNWSQFKR